MARSILTRFLLVTIVVGAAAAGGPVRTTHSAAIVFLRGDGDDVACNGTADAPASAAPNCAFQAVERAVSMAPPDATIEVTQGSFAPGAISIVKNVTIRGMSAEPASFFQSNTGAWFTCASGVFCAFENIEFDAHDNQNTIGILAEGSVDGERLVFKDFTPGLVPNTAGVRVSTGVARIEDSRFDSVHFAVEIQAGTSSSIKDSEFAGVEVGIQVFAPAAVISGNRFSNGGVAVQVSRASGVAPAAQAFVVGNDFGNSREDLRVGRDNTDPSGVDTHFNRFGSDSGLFTSPTSAVSATNNWWGCNSGPDIYPAATTCAVVLSWLPATAYTPWLTMTVGGPAATNHPRAYAADFTTNSEGESVASLGSLPDGVEVSFRTDSSSHATVAPAGLTRDGVARAKLRPGKTDGPVALTVSLDGQQLSLPIMIDRQQPDARIKEPTTGAIVRRLRTIAGSASDPRPRSGIAAVHLSVRRQVGAECAFWNGDDWVPRKCSARLWLRVGDGSSWSYEVPRGAGDAAATYAIAARATDRAGNVFKGRYVRGKNLVIVEVPPAS